MNGKKNGAGIDQNHFTSSIIIIKFGRNHRTELVIKIKVCSVTSLGLPCVIEGNIM